jgi:hypothetical protein
LGGPGNRTALQHANDYVSGGRRGQSESLHASHAKADKLCAPHRFAFKPAARLEPGDAG